MLKETTESNFKKAKNIRNYTDKKIPVIQVNTFLLSDRQPHLLIALRNRDRKKYRIKIHPILQAIVFQNRPRISSDKKARTATQSVS